ncbi:transcription termination factor Rho [Thermodesulfobacteriota bacterium]
MTEEIEKEEAQEEQKEEQKKEKKDEIEKPLDKMTAPELREVAKGIEGVTGVHAMKKDQLLEIIKEDRGIKDEIPAKKKISKHEDNVKELKQKIVALKEEKREARASKDKKKVDVLRRRMNRLKKRTRKVAQA